MLHSVHTLCRAPGGRWDTRQELLHRHAATCCVKGWLQCTVTGFALRLLPLALLLRARGSGLSQALRIG